MNCITCTINQSSTFSSMLETLKIFDTAISSGEVDTATEIGAQMVLQYQGACARVAALKNNSANCAKCSIRLTEQLKHGHAIISQIKTHELCANILADVLAQVSAACVDL